MIAGLAPRHEWVPNPNREKRSIPEAIEIARRWGVAIPDDVSFAVDRWRFITKPNCYAKTTTFNEPEGTIIPWRRLYHDQTRKIPFLLRADVLESDEAIVAVIGHEMYELEALRQIFPDGASIEAWHNETRDDTPGNCHCDAWDYADQLVNRMRSSRT